MPTVLMHTRPLDEKDKIVTGPGELGCPLIRVQIQWIQPVSAPGPDTVDTYRVCRVPRAVQERRRSVELVLSVRER